MMAEGILGLIESQQQIGHKIHKVMEPVLTVLEERFVRVYLKEVVDEGNGTVSVWFTTAQDLDGLYTMFHVPIPAEVIDNQDVGQIQKAVDRFCDKMLGL